MNKKYFEVAGRMKDGSLRRSGLKFTKKAAQRELENLLSHYPDTDMFLVEADENAKFQNEFFHDAKVEAEALLRK